MYIPKYFEVTGEQEIYAFIETNAFGYLISNSGGQLFSTYLLFLLSSNKFKLLCHLTKQNLQTKDIEGQEVLVILQGPHDYISPSWYVDLGVTIWNYQAVHVYRICNVFSDADELKQVVDMFARKYESNLSTPWQAERYPFMLGAILDIEINISDIQCKYKISQNRTAQDQKQVIEQLKNNDSVQLAEAMRKINNIYRLLIYLELIT